MFTSQEWMEKGQENELTLSESVQVLLDFARIIHSASLYR